MKKTLLAIAALTAVCALSFGQPQGGGFGPPQGPGGMRGGPGMGPGGGLQGPQLLMNPSVQKELKLTEEQKQELGKLMPQRGPGGPGGPPDRGQGGQRGQFGQGGQRGQGGQGGPPQGERRQGGPGGPNQEMEKKIQGILSDSQYRRYQEIGLQQQGAMALTRPEIAEKVRLTENQREQVRQILEQNRPGGRPPQGGERRDPAQMRAEMEKNQAALNAKVVAILSGEQKAVWQSMLGKPFKIEHPQGGPGFGGPGGPGGPGRGPGF